MYDCYNFHKDIHDRLNKAGIKCDFHVAKLANVKNPKYIHSISLFITEHGYKPPGMYINRLKKIIDKNKNKSVITRLYYDSSVEDSVLGQQHVKNLELIKYTFYDFYSNGKHDGLFGTLVRFLPFFKSKYGAKKVVETDCDLEIEKNIFDKCISQLNHADVCSSIYDCALMTKRISCKNALHSGLSALCVMTKYMLDLDILTRFLNDVKNKTSIIVEWSRGIIGEKHNAKLGNLFMYGIDEYFLNCHMVPAWKEAKCKFFTFKFMGHLRDFNYDLYKLNISELDVNGQAAIKNKLTELFNKHKIGIDNLSLIELIKLADTVLNNIIKNDVKEGIYRFSRFNHDYYNLLIDLNKMKLIKYSHDITTCGDHIEEFKNFSPPYTGGEISTTIIVVPYMHIEKNRDDKLVQFLSRIKKLISKKNIFVIIAEQNSPKESLNKDLLFNLGTKWFIDTHDEPQFIVMLDDITVLRSLQELNYDNVTLDAMLHRNTVNRQNDAQIGNHKIINKKKITPQIYKISFDLT